jgi:hypothetical protein
MWSRRTLVLPILLVGLVMSMTVPASAAVVTVNDRRGDAPARIDLTGVRYVNGPEAVSFRAHVVDLRESGTFTFVISQPAGNDSPYVAQVTNRGARFGVGGNLGTDWRGCAGMRRTWQPGLDLVTVMVPRRCLRGSQYSRALWLSMRSALGSSQFDWAAQRTVQRG